MSRTRCGILHAAPQSRDPALVRIAGPRLCSAPLRKSYALRCVRGTQWRLTRQDVGRKVGYAALFLISNESSYINAHTLFIDGGHMAGIVRG